MKTAFLVVMYNREINTALTIESLMCSPLSFHGSRLVIWNNGPSLLSDTQCTKLEDKGFVVELRQTIENMALSRIYNSFMSTVDADQYVILDHDSQVSTEYLSAVFMLKDTVIAVPIITSDGIVRSPHIQGVFEDRAYNNRDALVAIGSGLVLGQSLKTIFFSKYSDIFDEHYYLYGVDFTFFYRAKILGLIEKVQLIPGFEHGLSRLEKEAIDVAKFRRIERSYDFGLTLRFYPTKARIKRFIKYSLHFMLGRCHLQYSHICKAFITGKHYRDMNKKI